jgi:hypothetical protein
MAIILPFRPTWLVFPGTIPGINPAHPASSKAALCCIASNGTYIDLLSTGGLTRSGTATPAIDSLVGPSTGGAALFSKAIKNDSSSVTFAAIFRSTVDNNGFRGILNFNSSFSGIYLQGPGAAPPTQVELWNTAGFFASPAVLTPFPRAFFIAISSDATGTRYIATDLATGKISTGTNARVYTTSAGDTTLLVGNDNGDPSLCNVAAAMYSKTSLSVPQLLAWANDPWSFWYPNRFDLQQCLANPVPPVVVTAKGATLPFMGVG